MTRFVLVPGAGGHAQYWRWVVDELAARGHEGVAVDIAQDDPSLGLPEYADIVRAGIGERPDVVLVAQSFGGFVAPMVADRTPVARLVLVNAMIPLPGETPGAWWDAVGAVDARNAAADEAGRGHDFDVDWFFFEQLPPDVRAELLAGPPRDPASSVFEQPCTFARWPDVPIHVVVARHDRFFPPAFQQRVARHRLAVDADLIDGGHLVAAQHPADLADLLVGYLTDGGA